jgi:hypothetical protein
MRSTSIRMRQAALSIFTTAAFSRRPMPPASPVAIATNAQQVNSRITIENVAGITATSTAQNANGIFAATAIGSTGSPVSVENSPISVDNSGDIEADQLGILALSYGANSSVTIANSGSVTATGAGIYESAAIIGIATGADSSVVINNSGTASKDWAPSAWESMPRWVPGEPTLSPTRVACMAALPAYLASAPPARRSSTPATSRPAAISPSACKALRRRSTTLFDRSTDLRVLLNGGGAAPLAYGPNGAPSYCAHRQHHACGMGEARAIGSTGRTARA